MRTRNLWKRGHEGRRDRGVRTERPTSVVSKGSLQHACEPNKTTSEVDAHPHEPHSLRCDDQGGGRRWTCGRCQPRFLHNKVVPGPRGKWRTVEIWKGLISNRWDGEYAMEMGRQDYMHKWRGVLTGDESEDSTYDFTNILEPPMLHVRVTLQGAQIVESRPVVWTVVEKLYDLQDDFCYN